MNLQINTFLFQGWTALQLAVLNGHTDIVSILLNKGANTTIINRLLYLLNNFYLISFLIRIYIIYIE